MEHGPVFRCIPYWKWGQMSIAMLVYWMVNCQNTKKHPPSKKNNKQRHGAIVSMEFPGSLHRWQVIFLSPNKQTKNKQTNKQTNKRPRRYPVGQARLRFWAKEIQAAVQAGRHCAPFVRWPRRFLQITSWVLTPWRPWMADVFFFQGLNGVVETQ